MSDSLVYCKHTGSVVEYPCAEDCDSQCAPDAPPGLYDSRPETYAHILRVQELLAPIAAELVRRGIEHDRSKVQDPERSTFDRFTPKLRTSTYGSEEYKGFLAAMGDGLKHHYDHNRHHPEHHPAGIRGMNLIDLIEMLADWKAATERHDDGNMTRSLHLQRERFGIEQQLWDVLFNTAGDFDWLDPWDGES